MPSASGGWHAIGSASAGEVPAGNWGGYGGNCDCASTRCAVSEFPPHGYTTSVVHPYSAVITLANRTRVNYIRNSVKATIDAHSGETKLYIFDESDPIVQAYAHEFPALFTDQAEMPADLREHVRYPLAMFEIQAELYRTFHMTDPEVFYNKEDE